jgi:acetyl esterase/lipase
MASPSLPELPTQPYGPPPPFDPECGAVLPAIHELLPASVTPEMLEKLRADLDRLVPPAPDEALRRDGAFSVEERTVPGPAGSPEISLLICRPTSDMEPVPVLYHTHGGGMTTGTNRRGIEEPLDWAQQLGIALVSVEYRLAPQTRHPGPIEDCYAGLVWLAEHAVELGMDAHQIVVVGQSSGGGLAASLTLLARDRGGPAIIGQLLMCPMLDDRNDTVSARQMAGIGVWDRTSNQTGWSALLGEAAGRTDVSPYAAAARAVDLSGLPPTYIDVGSAETFRDEDVLYASRIWQAGGIAELHVWPGGFHGYYGSAPHAAIARETLAARIRWLRRLLAR